MIKRLNLEITGFVQGVGFRPFVYRLAKKLGLIGWVYNDLKGVTIEIQGLQKQVNLFLEKLKTDLPSVAKIETCKVSECELKSQSEEQDFIIKFSNVANERVAVILPDLATCNDCIQEVFDKNNRRYLYPFTNCTQCGPRFSIIKELPYDRKNTSMHEFKMCKQCQEEYNNVECRRFHAQPNACWDCGPQIELINAKYEVVAQQLEAFDLVESAIKQGKIVAVKGIGGFHLFVDAENHDAIKELRIRKNREDKPFAVMMPNLQQVEQNCIINEFEKKLLMSQQAPIILLRNRNNTLIANNVAPNNPYLGIMLPYTPLHHIILRRLNSPVVATSGNISGEPICTSNEEAVLKLSKIADLFLTHNRKIVNRIDDSVIRSIGNKKIFLRRARGYSPYYSKHDSFTKPILAVGSHMKNTFALSQSGNIFLSQHIGDLESLNALQSFSEGIKNIQSIYDFTTTVIACDLHKDYLSTKYALKNSEKQITVQHHHAHIASVMVEKKINGPVLGIIWDGSGLGIDGTIWGGEFLIATYKDFKRVGNLALIPLPGSEKAIKEPYRIAIGMLTKLSKNVISEFSYLNIMQKFKKTDLELLLNIIGSNINTPFTSSVGRLFDGVSALLGLRERVSFEGQAAMELEFLAEESDTTMSYNFDVLYKDSNMIIDWKLFLQNILIDIKNNESLNVISKKFHNTLVEIVVYVANKINLKEIVLAGGCFQNSILLKNIINRLEEKGFLVHWPEEIPINDGGIAIGQLAIANAIT